MSGILFVDMCYCSLCDRYFPGERARAEHVQDSPNHPLCEPCGRRYANKNSLRNHWVYSTRHHYCIVCERNFETAGGLRVHMEFSAVHRDDSDDDSDEDEYPGTDEDDEDDFGWEDSMGRRIYPEEDQRADDDFSVGPENDNGYAEEDEYWDEDDVPTFEEEHEAFMGSAPPPSQEQLTIMRRDPNYLSTETIRGIPVTQDSALSPPAPKPTGAQRVKQKEKGKAQETDSSASTSGAGILFTCPLCLEPPKESSATRCGHLFCTQCINQALAVKRSCPVCRTAAVPLQLRKIYLSAN